MVGGATVVGVMDVDVDVGSTEVDVGSRDSEVATGSAVEVVEAAADEFATDEEGPEDVLAAALVRNESETVGRPAMATPASAPTTAIPTEIGHLLRMSGKPYQEVTGFDRTPLDEATVRTGQSAEIVTGGRRDRAR